MKIHFLQSDAWANFQEKQGRQVFRESGDGWRFLAILERGAGNTRLYTPYGPSAKTPEAFRGALDALMKLARDQHATFVRVEPTTPDFQEIIQRYGGHRVSYQHLQPEHTSVVDLTLSEEEIIARMAQVNRNLRRNYHKKGITIHHTTEVKDMQIFLTFIHKVAARTGMRPHSDEYFLRQAESLFADNAAELWYATAADGTPVAAALLYYGADTCYYAHAAASSNKEHRKLYAANPLISEAMLDAKCRGLHYFDFYGIAPPDAPDSHPWAGFTKFKKSFGGADVTFGGAWDIPLKTLPYWFYRTYQTIYHALRARR